MGESIPGNNGSRDIRQPTDDISRSRLAEGLSSRVFDAKLLQNPEITEKGEIVDTDEGHGQLVRIPSLEGFSWNIPVGLILRNPKQPREYFDEKKMKELEETISQSGQELDLQVIPIKLVKTGEIKLFILDGERRFRVMKDCLTFKHVNAQIKFVKNFWELFAKSFMVNESRAPQNPIEKAKVYKYLLDNPSPEMGRKLTVTELAKFLGTESSDIYVHLKLLSLDPEIQTLIITDRLPRTNALELAATAKKLGNKLKQAKLARRLLKMIQGDESVELTQKIIDRAIQDTLVKGGEEIAAKTRHAHKAAVGITKGTGRASFAASQILDADPGSMMKAIRERPTPPEAVADELRATIASMSAALTIVEEAAKAAPLPEIEGKPKFSEYIMGKLKTFGHGTRKKMARLLANHADSDQNVLTATGIAKTISVETVEISANLKLFRDELEKLGLKLECHQSRELDEHNQYRKVPAYRIAWIIEEEQAEALQTKTEQEATKAAYEAADNTRKRVLQALGANRRSDREESGITDEDNISPLLKIEGKSSYLKSIETHEINFARDRLSILLVLAKESDEKGTPLSASEIASKIKDCNSVAVANAMRFLKKDLEPLGLEIQQFIFLRKNDNNENEKITCYRLAWIVTADTSTEQTPKPVPALTLPAAAQEISALKNQVEKLTGALRAATTRAEQATRRAISAERQAEGAEEARAEAVKKLSRISGIQQDDTQNIIGHLRERIKNLEREESAASLRASVAETKLRAISATAGISPEELATLRQTAAKLQQAEAALISAREEHSRQKTALTTSLDAARGEASALKTQLEELHPKAAEADALREQVAALTRELQETKEMLETLTAPSAQPQVTAQEAVPAQQTAAATQPGTTTPSIPKSPQSQPPHPAQERTNPPKQDSGYLSKLRSAEFRTPEELRMAVAEAVLLGSVGDGGVLPKSKWRNIKNELSGRKSLPSHIHEERIRLHKQLQELGSEEGPIPAAKITIFLGQFQPGQ